MKIMLLIIILLGMSACMGPEQDFHSGKSSPRDISRSFSLQTKSHPLFSARAGKEALQEADRVFQRDSTFSSDSLCRAALKYYKRQKASAELSRIYFYLGSYYSNQHLYLKSIEAYSLAESTLPEGSDPEREEKIKEKLKALSMLCGQDKTEGTQWQTRYTMLRKEAGEMQKELCIWQALCMLLGASLSIIILVQRYRTRRRQRELFESQLFIENLQRAEDDLKERLMRRLDEKDVKLRDFFNQRIEQIKEFIELSRKYGNNLEKLKVKFNNMVSTSSFTSSDWQLLKEGVNSMNHGIIGYLEEHYPNLTEENLRYCALICAGFETDELAILWEISSDSIYKRRTRLRQKLGIEKNQDLKLFLNELIEEIKVKKQ